MNDDLLQTHLNKGSRLPDLMPVINYIEKVSSLRFCHIFLKIFRIDNSHHRLFEG